MLVKDVKSTVLNILSDLKETIDKKPKEIRKMVYEQNEDMNK